VWTLWKGEKSPAENRSPAVQLAVRRYTDSGTPGIVPYLITVFLRRSIGTDINYAIIAPYLNGSDTLNWDVIGSY
jgi:hypothetical protein